MILLQQTLLGIFLGLQYALVATGLALIFGVMRVANVAHGDFMTLGGYIAFALAASSISSQILGIALTVVIMFGFGVILDLLCFRRLRQRRREGAGDADTSAIVVTLGLSIIISNAVLAYWGANYKAVSPLVPGVVGFLGIRVTSQRLVASGIAIILIGCLFLFLHRTKIGLAIRAVSQNANTVRSFGIDINHIYMLTFGIATALAGAAGPLLSPDISLSPFMGFSYTIKAIIIVVLGGLGSVTGALIGSIALGIAEALAVLYVSVQFASVTGLLMMTAVLVIRPQGLLGRQSGII